MNNEPSQKPEIIDISKKVNEFTRFSLIGFLLLILCFWTGFLYVNEIQDKADFCERNLSNIRYQSYRQGIYLKKTASRLNEHFIFGEPIVEREFSKYLGTISIEMARADIFYDLIKNVYPIWMRSEIFQYIEIQRKKS